MSKLIESRAEFQQLADVRLQEAKLLLDAGMWNGAYYLAGYAVELALKACIIRMLLSTDEFPHKEFSRNCYTHSLDDLIKVARLANDRDIAMNADVLLEANWTFIKDWTEQKRYHMITQIEAESLYLAIADSNHGVLPWVKTCW